MPAFDQNLCHVKVYRPKIVFWREAQIDRRFVKDLRPACDKLFSNVGLRVPVVQGNFRLAPQGLYTLLGQHVAHDLVVHCS